MLGSAAGIPSGPSGREGVRLCSCLVAPFVPCLRTPARRNLALHNRNHFPLFTCLASLTACLGAVFGSFIVLEASDGDLELWPCGADTFTAASGGHLLGGGQATDVLTAVLAVCAFVITAGAYLVLRYRARSALATNNSCNSLRGSWPSPGAVAVTRAPALGRCVFQTGGDSRRPNGKAARI
jgi:hypothetical protein